MQRIEAKNDNKDINKSGKDKKSKDVMKKVASISGHVIALIGILCVIGGFAILIYQFHYWLKTDKWLAMPFSVILSKVISLKSVYNSEWKGMAELLIWITNQSSFLILITCGSIITIIGDILYMRAGKDYKGAVFEKKSFNNIYYF